MKTFIIAFLSFLFIQIASAGSALPVGETRFFVLRPHALNAMFDSMDDIAGILKQYKPQGAQIRNLSTRGNHLSFKVVKGIFSAKISAIVEVVKSNPNCPADSVAGFQILMDLAQSDDLVSKNLESLRVDFCVNEPVADQLQVVGKGFVTKASTFSSGMGNMLLSGMAEQVPAVGEAVRAHIMTQP